MLQGAKRVAVDTESNSLYAYRPRVCLIQLSTDSTDALIDPLQVDVKAELACLEELFADPSVEKVFHAAEYDVMGLRRDFGFSFANLFDTMTAARILGWDQFGLGAILEQRFGITLNKRHQRANWGQRPLSPALIRYAQMDTHYLLPLRDELFAMLEAGGHLEEARELFSELCEVEWQGMEFDPQGFWRIGGAHSLEPEGIAVLRELYLYRDEQARQRDVPPFKIMTDQTLLALAATRPRSMRQLAQIADIGAGQVRRYGAGILEAVRRGVRAGPPSPPRHYSGYSNEQVMRRFEALHAWRKQRAVQRGVSSEVVMPRDVLWELAQVAPRNWEQLRVIRSIGPWRLKTYGDEILQVLDSVDAAQPARE
jgi:ribonuclease D